MKAKVISDEESAYEWRQLVCPTDTPPPSSYEAKSRGCICKRGVIVRGSIAKTVEKNRKLVNGRCPLHGRTK